MVKGGQREGALESTREKICIGAGLFPGETFFFLTTGILPPVLAIYYLLRGE
jgi:hypothetical protein